MCKNVFEIHGKFYVFVFGKLCTKFLTVVVHFLEIFFEFSGVVGQSFYTSPYLKFAGGSTIDDQNTELKTKTRNRPPKSDVPTESGTYYILFFVTLFKTYCAQYLPPSNWIQKRITLLRDDDTFHGRVTPETTAFTCFVKRVYMCVFFFIFSFFLLHFVPLIRSDDGDDDDVFIGRKFRIEFRNGVGGSRACVRRVPPMAWSERNVVIIILFSCRAARRRRSQEFFIRYPPADCYAYAPVYPLP